MSIKEITDPVELSIFALIQAMLADAWNCRDEENSCDGISVSPSMFSEKFDISIERAAAAMESLASRGFISDLDSDEDQQENADPCKICHSAAKGEITLYGICKSCSGKITNNYLGRYGRPESRDNPDSSEGVRRRRPLSHAKRMQVFERDLFACKHCGAQKDLTVDHIVPFSLGGECTMDNYQTLCKSCNSSKGARTETIQ